MSTLLNKDLQNITLRKEQEEALDFVMDTFENNSNTKNILLDLPTGVGKSILALKIAQEYKKTVNKHAKFDIITNSKMLQEQYVDEFNSPANLWGKNNYDCAEYSCSCESGKEFNKLNKSKCDNCPYDESKKRYLSSDINLTNFHMFIMLNLYQPDILKSRGSNVLIIDEAHGFEQVFSDYVSLNLGEFNIKKFKLSNSKAIIKSLKNIKDTEKFVEFCNEYLVNEISSKLATLKNEIKNDPINDGVQKIKRNNNINSVIGEQADSIKNINLKTELENYASKLDNFLKDYEKQPENWVLEQNYSTTGKITLSIQPVWSHPYLPEIIWDKYDHVILMSGTILSKQTFAYLNGMSMNQTEYYSIDSPFKVTNRPIYYMPIGKMSYTKKEDSFKKMVPYIEKILKKYRKVKGVIHSHTYEIQGWVQESIVDNRILYHDTKDKERALKRHLYGKDDTSVMCSPSISTGVNLEDGHARFQVMLKVPYPSLASKKNKIRQKSMPEWYNQMTVAGFIQMYGRAVRSYSDKADFIILDASFGDMMNYSGHLFPNWVSRAIKKVDVKKLK